MGSLKEKLKTLYKSRWFVFVGAMWLQSWAGIGYLFGSISPVIKRSLNYNQKQLAMLGVAKDLGDCVGFVTGVLCEILPIWAALFVGASLNLVGYGWVWLIVTSKVPTLPLWAVSIFQFSFYLQFLEIFIYFMVYVLEFLEFLFIIMVFVI
jgi:hypothetical protein